MFIQKYKLILLRFALIVFAIHIAYITLMVVDAARAPTPLSCTENPICVLLLKWGSAGFPAWTSILWILHAWILICCTLCMAYSHLREGIALSWMLGILATFILPGLMYGNGFDHLHPYIRAAIGFGAAAMIDYFLFEAAYLAHRDYRVWKLKEPARSPPY